MFARIGSEVRRFTLTSNASRPCLFAKPDWNNMVGDFFKFFIFAFPHFFMHHALVVIPRPSNQNLLGFEREK
jgi:hypothetical protein